MLIMWRLAQSCCRGIAAEGLGEKMTEKYAYALHLVLTDCAERATEAVLDRFFRYRKQLGHAAERGLDRKVFLACGNRADLDELEKYLLDRNEK